MNTQKADSPNHPLGYWLKATDRLMAAEFATAFQNEGITRRDWRLLNVVDGTAPSDHRLPAHKLGRLIELGWVARSDAGWSVTDEGRAAKERLSVVVDGIRLKVTDAVSPEDYATTIATLEQIARAYGWEEGIDLPRGHRRGHHEHGGHRGFGRGHGFDRGHGSGRGHGIPGGFGFGRHGFHPRDDVDHDHHGHPFAHRGDAACREGGHHGRGGAGRFDTARAAQHAYERGFDAGIRHSHG